jgi:hypothetical protein
VRSNGPGEVPDELAADHCQPSVRAHGHESALVDGVAPEDRVPVASAPRGPHHRFAVAAACRDGVEDQSHRLETVEAERRAVRHEEPRALGGRGRKVAGEPLLGDALRAEQPQIWIRGMQVVPEPDRSRTRHADVKHSLRPAQVVRPRLVVVPDGPRARLSVLNRATGIGDRLLLPVVGEGIEGDELEEGRPRLLEGELGTAQHLRPSQPAGPVSGRLA